MVSNPTYDPNTLASHDFGSVTETYQALEQDPAEPLINRAIGTTLPPGSTFKLVTAAAAIESGDYDAESIVPGGTSYQLPQSTTKVGNQGGGDCGGNRITLTQALQVSCNVTFLSLADELGIEAMTEQAEKFGFNATSLEDLDGQARSLYPPDMDAAADRAVGHRPVERHRHPAPDGHGLGRHRQRRRGHAALRRRRGPRAQPRRCSTRPRSPSSRRPSP